VIAPGRSIQMPALQPNSWRWPFSGNQVSCVPQPSSAGWKPSAMKPSTDQVLTKVPRGFGWRRACVSRSAIWTPLTPERLHQPRPAGAVGGHRDVAAGVGGEAHQRLLHEPAHHAGIGAAAGHGGRAAGVLRLLVPHGLAEGIVGPRRVVLGLEVVARPGLHHGVDVEDADLAAEFHEVERRGVDAQVHAEAPALGEEPAQNLAVVRLRDRDLEVADPALSKVVVRGVIGLDHRQLLRVEFEMPLDQRERALADRAEADDDDRAVDPAVNGVIGRHGDSFPKRRGLECKKPRRLGAAPRVWLRVARQFFA
jgi:hypothetical protein